MDDLERAAVLLYSIGADSAGDVIKHLNSQEVQKLGAAMAEVNKVQREELSEVFNHFVGAMSNQTGVAASRDDYIRDMLKNAMGAEQAAGVSDRILMGGDTSGLDTLKWMEPREIADVIRYEHPQIVTIVLCYIDSDIAAEVLRYLPENTRTDLMMRVASLKGIQPSALQELNGILEDQFSGSSGGTTRNLGGLKAAANIMNLMDGNMEAKLMEELKERDLDMGESIEDLMFVFGDLAGIDDRSMQRLLQDINQDTLMLALKGADGEIMEKVLNNMSKRAADLLRDDLEVSQPAKVSDVEAAQKEILLTARKLADLGEIILVGGDDEMI